MMEKNQDKETTYGKMEVDEKRRRKDDISGKSKWNGPYLLCDVTTVKIDEMA